MVASNCVTTVDAWWTRGGGVRSAHGPPGVARFHLSPEPRRGRRRRVVHGRPRRRARVRDRWDGHAGRDAGARHAAAAPAPGGAPARRDARARLPRRRYWGGDARTRDARLDARVD